MEEHKSLKPRAKHIVIIVKRIFKHFVMFCPLPSYTLLYLVHCKIALNFASSILTEINETFPSLFEFDPLTNLTHPWLSAFQMAQPQRYSDKHRIFLQGIMCKGILDQKEVRNLYKIAMARVEGMLISPCFYHPEMKL